MLTPGDRLRCLAALLSAPVEESRAALHALTEELPWLTKAAAELDTLDLETWQAEHTRLFVNGHPKTVCPPFECAWIDGHMPGPASGEIAALYRRMGVESELLLPDYLGTLFECAALLEDTASPCAQELRAELWEGHLARWLPNFAAALGEHSMLTLYRELAARILELLKQRAEGAFHDPLRVSAHVS